MWIITTATCRKFSQIEYEREVQQRLQEDWEPWFISHDHDGYETTHIKKFIPTNYCNSEKDVK